MSANEPEWVTMSIASQLRSRTWRRESHLISTDASLIPVTRLNEFFARDGFYWGKPLPEEVMAEMLHSSLCFGLYEVNGAAAAAAGSESEPAERDPPASSSSLSSSLTFIGLARCVTDFVTFLYVTDVWIEPEKQGGGLGRWLVGCVQEVVESMPHLRRSVLFTADWERSVPFYQKLMDMDVVEFRQGEGLALMERKGAGHPSFESKGSGYKR